MMRNVNTQGDDSEGTPLLQPQQQQQQQQQQKQKQKQKQQKEQHQMTQEALRHNNAFPQPMAPQIQMHMNPNVNSNVHNPTAMAAYATLAAQYEQAGYAPSDAAAAAASMAAYQQQQQQMHSGGSAFGYPPHVQPQMYYSSQTQQYIQQPIPANSSPLTSPTSSQLPFQGQIPSSRPPRSSRRASSPVFVEGASGNNSNSLPPLQDIFTNSTNNNDLGTIFNNSNYGSMTQGTSPIWTSPPLSKPGASMSGGAKRGSPILVRTSSSGAIGPLGTSPNQSRHRRSSSDLMPINRHQRAGSADSSLLLPPLSGTSGHRRTGSFGGPIGAGGSVVSGSSRPRAMSSSGSLTRSRRSSVGHRRTASSGSVITLSSQLSTGSVRSDIAQSSMFGGFDPHTGQVQMHFPFEGVRLVFVDDEKDQTTVDQQGQQGQRHQKLAPVKSESEPTLNQGHLYMQVDASDFEKFEDYTDITNAMEEGLTPQWETLDRVSTNDDSNLNVNSILKPPSYLLPTSAKVYKRMVAEISDAHYMPCGLFFCGHHEDVAHPSIGIAVVIVILLFSSMAYVAYFIEGS